MANKYPNNTIDIDILDSVIYSHLHGVNLSDNISHISLLKSDINFNDTIKLLKNKNIPIILELLVSYCNNTYLDDLFNDINYVNNVK